MVRLLEEMIGMGGVAQSYESWRVEGSLSKSYYIKKFKTLTDDELVALVLSGSNERD